jgi:translocation and assembly module TamA
MRRPARLIASLLFALVPLGASAAVRVKIEGLNESLTAAVKASVELSQYAKRDASAAQVRRLYAHAPDEVRKALQPYGYYDASVDGSITPVGNDWQVVLKVAPGEPVRIASVDIELDAVAA